jgi:hypothetical protein
MSSKLHRWSITTVNTLRQCNRKYYFASILSNHHFGNKLKRKAFELKHMQNLTMWPGTVVDKVMELVVIPKLRDKEQIDFEKVANDAIELAKKQFHFSENKYYLDPEIDRTELEGEWCILDIHENDKPYSETDILKAYDKIKQSILNIPQIQMPGTNKLLVDFISESMPILPNVNTWSFEIEHARIAPQMDLIMHNKFKPVVIDWKVSDSFVSDYSRQLVICGLTVYFTRLRKVAEGKKAYEYNDIKLYEVNLYKAEVKEHEFNEERANELIDYINKTGEDIALLRQELTGDEEKDFSLFGITENEVTCDFCNFHNLCQQTLLNKNKYDETAYSKLVQDRQPQ